MASFVFQPTTFITLPNENEKVKGKRYFYLACNDSLRRRCRKPLPLFIWRLRRRWLAYPRENPLNSPASSEFGLNAELDAESDMVRLITVLWSSPFRVVTQFFGDNVFWWSTMIARNFWKRRKITLDSDCDLFRKIVLGWKVWVQMSNPFIVGNYLHYKWLLFYGVVIGW